MSTHYATERVAAAIQKHLIEVDATPPTIEATRLANEITEIVWTELNDAGLTRETLEGFFVATNRRARAQANAGVAS
jgi:hypothetical protein